jgi:hypothetical protein
METNQRPRRSRAISRRASGVISHLPFLISARSAISHLPRRSRAISYLISPISYLGAQRHLPSLISARSARHGIFNPPPLHHNGPTLRLLPPRLEKFHAANFVDNA